MAGSQANASVAEHRLQVAHFRCKGQRLGVGHPVAGSHLQVVRRRAVAGEADIGELSDQEAATSRPGQADGNVGPAPLAALADLFAVLVRDANGIPD